MERLGGRIDQRDGGVVPLHQVRQQPEHHRVETRHVHRDDGDQLVRGGLQPGDQAGQGTGARDAVGDLPEAGDAEPPGPSGGEQHRVRHGAQGGGHGHDQRAAVARQGQQRLVASHPAALPAAEDQAAERLGLMPGRHRSPWP